MISYCFLSGPAKCLCSKVEACQFSAGAEVGLLTNVTVETDCRDLCSNNTDCHYYTWYDGSQSLLGLTCLLLSSCARRDSLCSSCHTAPVPCSGQISPPPPQALIMSGGGGEPSDPAGNSLEVFLPSTGQHCHLPAMPGEERVDHSMEGLTVCGGYSSHKSCISLSDGVWQNTTTLLQARVHHCSWSSGSGVFLLGGRDRNSSLTTEKIQENGTSTESFDLKYVSYHSCAINLGPSVILTGGLSDNQTRVVEYSEQGFLREFPRLHHPRYQHGCSYFDNEEGTKVNIGSISNMITTMFQTFIVVGGYIPPISSTELLVETASAWEFAGNLPSPRTGLRAANIDTKILVTGQ